METGTKRAVIYIRVSTDKQAEGTSLEAQERVCWRKAQDMEARVIRTVRDEGVSGAFYYSREGIQEALRDIESGAANVLLVAKLDRAGRDVDALRDIRQRVRRAGGEMIFADGLNFANDATGNLMFNQMSAFAEYERQLIFERTMSGRRNRAVSGEQPQRSRLPYGYNIPCKEDVLSGKHPAHLLGKYLLNEEQAEHARYIFTSYAAGKSLSVICKALMQQGVRSPSGGLTWWPESVSKMITNPVYKGVATYGRRRRRTVEGRTDSGRRKQEEQSVPESEWLTLDAPAIVDAQTWEQCQQRLAENKARLGGNPGRRYLLVGMLVCPICGSPTHGSTNKTAGEKRKYYRCNQHTKCKAKQFRMDIADNLVIDGLIAASRQSKLFRVALEAYEQHRAARPAVADTDAERARLQADLDALRKEEQRTVQAQIAGMASGASADAYSAAFKSLDDRRKLLDTRLASLTPVQTVQSDAPLDRAAKLESVLSDVEQALTSPDLTTAEKHNLISLLVQQIIQKEDGLTMLFRNSADTVNDVSISSATSNPF